MTVKTNFESQVNVKCETKGASTTN